ncbi:uncharacterized protein Tco025E_02369 [Trypanosoma conorhini]|uniref:Enriched in surface-labeled proteome protein 11 n=1 Tax=Trypanosoma conorhini TaxID=83891 RepID=A0A422Q3Z2_9TRYP|nr:uncharacterized protein Tco025E_02369 [Trypanosoma conorhini]RNF24689.1 hypothetical protein Tco025E_02369 [Trypanosoma conorhini]
MILYSFLVALVALFFSSVVSASDRCRPIEKLRGINPNILALPNVTFFLGNEYFCAENAPRQFHCQCSVASVCTKQEDPWGRDIGVCSCCPWWMIILFVVLGAVMVASVSTVLYVWCCRGKWWWDGYPPPVKFVMCRRGPATVVPTTGPLPPNLFRGYRISDFVSGAAEPQPTRVAAAASSNDESRRVPNEYPQQSQQQSQQQQQRQQAQVRLCERNSWLSPPEASRGVESTLRR